jgi:hypothetical protein
MQLGGAEVRGHAPQLDRPGQGPICFWQPVAAPANENQGPFCDGGPQLPACGQTQQVSAGGDASQPGDCLDGLHGPSLHE